MAFRLFLSFAQEDRKFRDALVNHLAPLWMNDEAIVEVLDATSVDFSDPTASDDDRTAPQALLWLNPLVTDIDLMCTAVPDITIFCDYIGGVVDQTVDRANPPRDAWWPRSVVAIVLAGVLLVLASTQLISPSRRYRRPRRGPAAPPPSLASPDAA